MVSDYTDLPIRRVDHLELVDVFCIGTVGALSVWTAQVVTANDATTYVNLLRREGTPDRVLATFSGPNMEDIKRSIGLYGASHMNLLELAREYHADLMATSSESVVA